MMKRFFGRRYFGKTARSGIVVALEKCREFTARYRRAATRLPGLDDTACGAIHILKSQTGERSKILSFRARSISGTCPFFAHCLPITAIPEAFRRVKPPRARCEYLVD